MRHCAKASRTWCRAPATSRWTVLRERAILRRHACSTSRSAGRCSTCRATMIPATRSTRRPNTTNRRSVSIATRDISRISTRLVVLRCAGLARARPQRPAPAATSRRRRCRTSRCSTARPTTMSSPALGQSCVAPPPARSSRRRDAGPRRLRPCPSVSRDHGAGARMSGGPPTAFVMPDRLQPRGGIKEVGYAEQTLRPDGTHDSRLVRVPGIATLSIAGFPRPAGQSKSDRWTLPPPRLRLGGRRIGNYAVTGRARWL